MDKVASVNNTDVNCQNPSTSSPVVIATGEKYKVEQDFIAGSASGLDLQRTYRSFNTTAKMFGPRWLSAYDYRVLGFSGCYRHPDIPNKCFPTEIIYGEPDGSTFKYTRWIELDYKVSNSASGGILSYAGNSWELLKDRKQYSFSLTGGAIQRIAEGGVALLTFEYGSSSPIRPTRVTNSAGQSVQFVWSGSRVIKATDPAGNEWNYGYNANGMLSTVTSPGSNPDVRTYHYEDAADTTLLTGVSINSVRYSTYAYYSDKRVRESGLAGGEHRDTLTYGAQTTVTSATGQAVTYGFAPVQGGKKVSSVSRAASSSCPAASAQTVYDANGWVDYELDWNGNKTDYTYDAAGLLLQVTRAAGTPNASTRVNTWAGDYLMESKYQDSANIAYAKVNWTYVSSGPGLGKVASETWTDLRAGGTRQISYAYAFHPNGVMATMTATRSLPAGGASTDDATALLRDLTMLGHRPELFVAD